MVSIKINTKCRQYKKEDQITKKSINMILEKLAYKILSEGKDINSIYNNRSIIYDRINDNILMHKAHGVNNTQLRIVYGVEINNGNAILYMIDYINKKKNNKQYLSEFNARFKNSTLSDMTYMDIACLA